jgi:murein DD-endopeptidase MepM/ murein hydrolase activator NlpD
VVLLLDMRRLGLSTLASVRRVTAVGLTLACTAAVGISTSAADTGDDRQRADQQVRQLEDALEGTSTELVAAYQAWQATAAQLPAAQTALADAQAKEKAATEHNNDVAGRLAVAGANEARAVEVLRSNAVKLQATQSSLDNFAADMFQGGGGSQLSVALGSVGAHDFATRVVLADQVSSLTKTALQDLQTIRAAGTAQEAYLRAVRAEVADLVTQAEAALSRAASARAAAVQAKAALDQLLAQQEANTKVLNDRKVAEEAMPAQAQAEQGQLQALLVEQAQKAQAAEAARAAAALAANQSYTPPSGGTGFLSDPANAPITSEFGQRFHPILRIWKLHSGTDFGVPCGTPVYATADGTVVSAGWGGGDGNRTVIDHGILSGVDLMTAYNHLSSFVVQGGPVKRGQLIAYSGTTGYSTGCHLHFETLENGSFVNPRKWI